MRTGGIRSASRRRWGSRRGKGFWRGETLSGHGREICFLRLAVPEGCQAEHGRCQGKNPEAGKEAEERLVASASGKNSKGTAKMPYGYAWRDYPLRPSQSWPTRKARGAPSPCGVLPADRDLGEISGRGEEASHFLMWRRVRLSPVHTPTAGGLNPSIFPFWRKSPVTPGRNILLL